MSDSWVAIDFETATSSRASACAIGMVFVDRGAVVDERHLLLQPPANEYDWFNTSLHGIGPGDTAGAPSFAEAWPLVEDMISGRLVVAHNAGFDLSVLRHECGAAGITPEGIDYACTLVMGRKHWAGLPSYSLPLLCDHVGIALVAHHDALSDAHACVGLANRLLHDHGTVDLTAVARALGVQTGRLGETDRRCTASALRLAMPDPNLDADPDHPFYGARVAFTGTLTGTGWTRAEASLSVAALGGLPVDGVTKQTNYLVTGDQDPDKLRGRPLSGKAEKVQRLAAAGQDIQVLTEADFVRLLSS